MKTYIIHIDLELPEVAFSVWHDIDALDREEALIECGRFIEKLAQAGIDPTTIISKHLEELELSRGDWERVFTGHYPEEVLA